MQVIARTCVLFAVLALACQGADPDQDATTPDEVLGDIAGDPGDGTDLAKAEDVDVQSDAGDAGPDTAPQDAGLDLSPCTDPPVAWGPAGAIRNLESPATVDLSQAVCRDFTGDELGDNGLRALASQFSGILAGVMDPESVTQLLVVVDGLNGTADADDVVVAVLVGRSAAEPPVLGGDCLVNPSSYGPDCLPWLRLPGRVTSGALDAGPGTFQWVRAVDGIVLSYPFHDVRIQGRLVSAGPTGIALEDGLISGLHRKEGMDALLSAMAAACDDVPAPDWCNYRTVATNAASLVFDLHTEPDGSLVPKAADKPADIGSVCLRFDAVPAMLVQ